MALLVLVHEGLTIKRIPIDKPELLIGRKVDADIYVDDMLASQKHAKIKSIENKDTPVGVDYSIEDLQSTNHTFVNGEPVEWKQLAHGDVIRIGKHVFKFIDEAADPGDKTKKLQKSWIPGVYYTKD
jgi:pSer/pThr/pTyr-binding forkhead associated (FHA) protein